MSRRASHDDTAPTKSTTPQVISLLDRTAPRGQLSATTSYREQSASAEQSDSEQSLATPQRSLSKKLTNTSLQHSVRQHINRQKYARYQSYRYAAAQQGDDDATGSGQENDILRPRGLLERGRARTAELLRGKKQLVKEDERDAVLDILYENQRGSFFFGVPRFSSKSLLQIDAKPWQNADFRTSAVDIRNAQLPDPSWEWSWNSWYVDMSRDVDEQGWEYSFAFGSQFAWHGNHPWLFSFVRRRRWLRRRVRKDRHHKTKERGHELAADYFTIHTKVLSTASQLAGQSDALYDLDDENLDDIDIADVGSLSQHLRKARLDREKLVAIRAFMRTGTADDIEYLSKQMSDIMSLFLYQSSRRQLLAELVQQQKDISKRQEELAQHDHDDKAAQTKHYEETKRADNISHAIHAADQQIQKLEYWSDIRDMARTGNLLSDDGKQAWGDKRWQGLNLGSKSKAFSVKQPPRAPAAELHDRPEQQRKHSKPGNDEHEEKSKHSKHSSDETDSSAYTTAPSVAPSTRSAKPTTKRPSVVVRRDDDGGSERFVTASEGPVSSVKPKQYPTKAARAKGKRSATQLDGLYEEDENGEEDSSEGEHPRPPLHEVSAEDSRVDS